MKASDSISGHRTALYSLHLELGARMVPFAGYDMPVQYPTGILAEHRHTRAKASLFDVGHMGQAKLYGNNAAAALETLVPGDLLGLGRNRMRYTQLTNEAGGILDDLMVTRRSDHFFLVVNADRKAVDFEHIDSRISNRTGLEPMPERALIALQGPAASAVLDGITPGLGALPFMSITDLILGEIPAWVSRSGYTGEDGYEISVAKEQAESLCRLLLADGRVAPAGLGARDTLRLEAGLCLYGNDIDETTTPVEAGLAWSIGKRRRTEGGFLGSDTILRQIADGPSRRRVGLRPDGKVPARAGAPVETSDGVALGVVTSGGFGPTVDAPIAMGYIGAVNATPGTRVRLVVRGQSRDAQVAALPFVPHRYFKA